MFNERVLVYYHIAAGSLFGMLLPYSSVVVSYKMYQLVNINISSVSFMQLQYTLL